MAALILLSDLYDADRRTRDPQVRELAARQAIPHPLRSVQYADGIKPCTHAKKHAAGSGLCVWGDDR